MSVNANSALSLSTQTGFNIMLCKTALEQAKQNEDLAKKLLKNWTSNINILPELEQQRQKSYGTIYTYFDRTSGAASIVELKTSNALFYNSEEFRSLVGGIAYEMASAGNYDDLIKTKNLLEKTYDTKITCNALQFAKSSNQSLLSTYHHNGTIGTIVEIKIDNEKETSNKLYMKFAFDCALHIAAFNPLSIHREGISKEIVDKMVLKLENELREHGKELKLWETIIKGKMDKWFSQKALMEQTFIHSENISVKEEMKRVEELIKSKIEIVNFVRFAI